MKMEDISIYLPKYLSANSHGELLNGIKDFPSNIDSRIYTEYLKEKPLIFQGDGITDMLVINLPDMDVRKVPAMVLSNTCDIDETGKNLYSERRICYAPILNLNKYRKTLEQQKSLRQLSEEQIQAHIESITQQYVTQIFYLPAGSGLKDDSIVMLDRINNCSNKSVDRDQLKSSRLFTLSDYGLYLFSIKLAIHFNRFQEKVDRGAGKVL